VHVLRQLEKNHLAPGNSLQSQGNANRFACGACLRCANADYRVPQIGQAAENRLASQLANHAETVENRHLQAQKHNICRISMDEVKGFNVRLSL
jgi:NADH dehydrogenase FAD-containing subunit